MGVVLARGLGGEVISTPDDMPTLHIHLDEAGDWNFNPKGSPYFIITATWTFDPGPLARALTDLRYSLIRSGLSLEGFHASPDRQVVRDAVVRTMMAHSGWRFASIVLEKRRIHPTLHDPAKFYPQFAGALLRFILRGSSGNHATRVLIYADTLPINTRAKREGVLKAIRVTCSAELAEECQHHAFSHCHQSNAWIQVADYCCWGMHRKWANGDPRTYNQLSPRLAAPELVLTDRGDRTVYY